jgi:hypothetical protein
MASWGRRGQRIRLGVRPGGAGDSGPAGAAADREPAQQAGSGVRDAERQELGSRANEVSWLMKLSPVTRTPVSRPSCPAIMMSATPAR